MERLTDVFDRKGKGQALMAYLYLAQGEREKGTEELQKTADEMKVTIDTYRKDTKVLNVKK